MPSRVQVLTHEERLNAGMYTATKVVAYVPKAIAPCVSAPWNQTVAARREALVRPVVHARAHASRA